MFKLVQDITDDFFPTLARWQSGRALWLAGGLWALGLEIFSVLYFQVYLGLYPCEYCVQIRLSMILIFLGAAVAAVWPGFALFKLFGYAACMGAAAWGLSMSAALEIVNLKTAFTPGFLAPCRVGDVAWPLGLDLSGRFPTHFMPEGICGEDSRWAFLGNSMTQWLILVYLAMLVGLALMLVSWIASWVMSRKARREGRALGGGAN
ncbi:MAG: disulfide bond formation protein B [Deltaproteobacteria bacterium]|jgi:disulfide bond formation protein DsbB|nr:disulfide bond formation protein B [Deltaproteobacteria bacterium]